MLVRVKDASLVTIRNQNRMLFANYVMQRSRVENGCQLTMELENGGVADGSIIPKLLEGARATTAEERDREVASVACPVIIPPPPPDPYLTDKIYLSLTTNAAVYKAAASGTWIPITAAEYAAVQTNVSGTAVAGTSASIFAGAFPGVYSLQNIFTANRSAATAPAISANTYMYAFAIVCRTPLTTTMNDVRVYTNASTSVYSGFSQVSSVLPNLVAGINYFVLKGVSAVRAATDGLLAISAPGDNTINAQAYNILYSTTATGSGIQVNMGLTFPVTAATTMPSNGGNDWAHGIQALTTSTIQWVA